MLLAFGCGYGGRDFIPTCWLAGHLNKAGTVIIDAGPAEDYAAGHIPGAVHLWWRDFSDPDTACLLPDASLAAGLGHCGISGEEKILVYDDTSRLEGYAGRIAWMLQYMGHPDVHLLDGGLNKWKAEGRPLETAPAALPETAYGLSSRPELTADTAAVSSSLGGSSRVLVDIRPEEEYNGWQLYSEPRPGHIPGAVHLPPNSLYTDEWTLKPREVLLELFEDLGLTPDTKLIFYSTAGLRSGLGCFVARHLGFSDVANYDGSIMMWGRDASLPMTPGFKNPGLLYPVKKLMDDIAAGTAPVVLDCRSSGDYASGHIPGAVSMPAAVVSEPDFPNRLLDTDTLRAVLGSYGLSGAETAVIYTDPPDAWGDDGRLFWVLEYMGHTDVRILNGGWGAWLAAGGKTSTAAVLPQQTVFSGDCNQDLLATKEYIKNNLASDNLIIIDARTLQEYEGSRPYGCRRGGHIPGAVSFDYTCFFDDDWTLRDHDVLEQALHSPGIIPRREAVLYCTIGVRSGFGYFGLRLLGYERIRNYDGSWYEWAADASLPVEKGRDSH